MVQAQSVALKIQGDPPTQNQLLDSLLTASQFNDVASMSREIDSLKYRLELGGYLAPTFSKLQRLNDSTFAIKINPGIKYTIIKVQYDPGQIDKKTLSRLVSDINDNEFTLPVAAVKNTLTQLSQQLTQDGFPFASCQLVNLTAEDNLVRAALSIDYGNPRIINRIEVKGYEKFPKSFIKFYAGIKKGTPFDLEAVKEKYSNLSSLGFATSVKPPEVLFKKDSTTVYLYLDKTSNNSFDGILGFANNEEDARLVFNGYLDLTLSNNLNFGETLAINYKSDGRDQQNFRVRTNLPYLFGSPLGAELELYLFKRDSSFVSVDQKAQLFYQLSPKTQINAGYLYKESNNLLDQAISVLDIQDLTSNFVLGGITYNDPQASNLFPIKTRLNISGRVGTRKAALETSQTFIGFDGYHSFNLNARNSVFLRSTVETLLSEDYLTNELMRFGGINSIRGFDENSIDAQLFAVLNTEYRYLLNQGLYVHSIIDVGYFENELTNSQEELLSFGIGIGFLSRAGVFRLNIANGKTESLPFKFSNTKIHLSLRSNF